MRPRIVRTIALKELLEALRDRRTLFMMIFLPILLYPALLVLVTQVMSVQQDKLAAKETRVGIQQSAIDAEHPFLEHLRATEHLQIVGIADDADETLIGDDETVDVIIELGDWVPRADDLETGAIELHFKSVEERSRFALSRLRPAFNRWNTTQVAQRLQRHDLPASLAEPLQVAEIDSAGEEQRGGFLLGALLPFFVMITVILGAMYPAIDVTAGEKERGSIQTLFSAPISVLEILAGKYLAVVAIALISGGMNLVSMVLVFSFLGEQMLAGAEISLSVELVAMLLVNIVFIGIFFSAVVLSVAALARDFKDGQNLMTPIMLMATIPGMIAQMPGFELTAATSWIPAINVVLLMKQVLVDGGASLDALFLVGASTLVYTLLALLFAARVFSQESTIAGGRGSFDLLARPSDIEPKARPSIGEGLAWVSVSFVLLFYLGSWLQGMDAMGGLAGTLWLVILTPTVLVSLYLKVDIRETFSLRRPPALGLVGAVVMGLTAWLAVSALDSWLVQPFLPMSDALVEAMQNLIETPDSVGGWAVLILVMSVSPAICEEALFRGFLFSSLRDRVKPLSLILITGVLFGAFHLSIHRLFGTTTLGILMGFMVWRTRSIWPAVVFHALNNGTAILVSPSVMQEDGSAPLWATLVGFAGAFVGFGLLWRAKVGEGPTSPPAPPDH